MPARAVMPLLSRGTVASSRQTLLASRSCKDRTRSWVTRRSLSSLPNLPLFRALQNHDQSNLAVVHSSSARSFTYGNLVADVLQAKERLVGTDQHGLSGERVAFLAENSYDYVVTLLSILASDAIALPLSPAFPIGELKYIMDNSQAKVLVATEKYAGKAQDLLKAGLEREPVFDVKEKIKVGASNSGSVSLEDLTKTSRGGMMLYTSGTTNRPKGVLIPQSALTAQAASLLEAWRYTPEDRLLHLLPLHHIHGTVNAIVTPILAGSSIEFMFPFNTDAVWKRLAAPFLPSPPTAGANSKITFLTAVPTIYNRLLSSFPTLPSETQEAARKGISPENMRLNISGSAALPTPIKQAWKDLSNGNVLLERYGMTEVGMAISCGLDFADRVDGSVGWPLPSVEARLVDTETNEVIQPGEERDANGREREGEIQLRGPTIFQEYWANAKATNESFGADKDGKGDWFKTGDVATRRVVPDAGKGTTSGEWAQGPMYFIQGRLSVDIIKTGGEKVSALEVERELLSLPQIAEAAVVGLPSEQWGQKVAAIVVLKPDMVNTGRNGKAWGPLDMRRALKDRLASYKMPQEMKVLDGVIPRNAMGKVNKKTLVKEVFGI
ncbi:acetyl-CoA synthetase-like protein [Aspergillus heteromorphus CBS 117.55]|uniref:Acetyl-CoA synthetase-like protein n=1 Tax=Aspergillus heteromorphus CBS 117.55 TaxID=1448321 RepID=A0A317VRN3_9EURO|nr:acetyl-CoA synthetase-like protein [Aspergillus heteromorphus CBS 117.55]PWY77054.1 acetyl-CoA synthetase-like protein [Aspergillus heteromorphus CBS 117.55]